MPDGWVRMTVGDALQRVSRPVKVQPEQKYQQIGIRSHGKGLFDKEHVTGRDLGGKRVYWIEPNCFVVNVVFAWEQAVGCTNESDDGKIASHRFPMYRPRNQRCDVRFIEYFFKTPRGKYLLGMASPGGAGRNKTLGQKEFDRVPLTLPPLPEQRKIVDILSTWDRTIEIIEALLDTACTQKRALIQSLLTGKRRFSKFAVKEWEKVRLGDMVQLSKKRLNPKQEHSANSICIELEHIEAKTGRLVGSTQSDFQASIKAVFGPGDVLFGKLRPYLRKFLAPDFNGVCSTEIWVLQPQTAKLTSPFLHCLVQSDGFMVEAGKSSGSKMPRADWNVVSDYELQLPQLEEQARIVEVLCGCDKEVDTLNKQIEKLRTEKKALMQQLLTGKRRVTI